MNITIKLSKIKVINWVVKYANNENLDENYILLDTYIFTKYIAQKEIRILKYQTNTY